MRDYYIFKSGRLRRKDNTIEFESNDGILQPIPVNDMYCIHAFGEIDLNSKIIIFLNQNGIPIHFYNYYGYYSGSFYPREKLISGFLIVKQVLYAIEKEKRLEIAKEFVDTAIHNITNNLKQYKKTGKAVDDGILKIHQEKEKLDSILTIPELMGLEGRVRDHYYSSFENFLRSDFKFERRSRNPPHNMLNSLISFGNSLIYANTLTEIYHTQLNPAISYLHEPGERRFSLSLDISEVFKPLIVDKIVFNMINNQIVKKEHFDQDLNYCYLNEKGKRLFLENYQKKLKSTIYHSGLKRPVSCQRLIRLECFKLVKHILGEKKYSGLKY